MKRNRNYGKRLVSLMPVMLLWAAVWSAPTLAFGQTTDKWTCSDILLGGPNWNDAMNWNTRRVPSTTSIVVIPDATSTCAVNLNGTGNAGTLQIMAGGEVIVEDGSSLTINGTSIANDGQLFLNSSRGSSVTAALVIVGSVALTGNGKLVMSSSPNNIIGGGGSLTNQSTIEGGGTIGSGGQLTLLNDKSGIINADANARDFDLLLEPSSKGMINNGTLESTSGGVLGLSTGEYMNAGGTIGGDNVDLQGTTNVIIFGGTFSAGMITGQGFVTLHDITLAPGCQYILASGNKTTLRGIVTNNAQIKLNNLDPDGVSSTILVVDGSGGTVNLNGIGVITTSNSVNNRILGSGTIINGPQHTIESGVLIKVSGLNNQGMIIGNSTTAPMTVDCPSGTGVCTNSGLIEAESGGTTNITCTVSAACTLNDMGGNISANGGTVVLNGGVTVAGGTMTSPGGGVNHIQMATLNGSVNPFTLAGFAELLNDDSAELQGIIDFASGAQLSVDNSDCSGCSKSTVQVKGNVTLSPAATATTGTITMSSSPNNVIQGVTGTEVLTNNITIQGAGNIGNGLLNLVNGTTGQIMANSSSVSLVIAMGPGNVFRNLGLLSVAANSGSAASILTVTGKLANFNPTTSTLTGGKFLINGTLQFDNANIVTNAANLTMAGQIVNQANVNALANFTHNAATGSLTVLPQTFGTNFTSAGPFTNAGKVTIVKGVAFVVGGSGTNYNQTGGTTTVDGRLAVPLGGLVNITGGTLQGGGALPVGSTITGSVSLGNASGTAGTFIIGDSIKKSGLLAITNNYAQLATGAMDVQISGTTPGTRYSQLNITGTAALTGTLNIALINNFKPTIGQTFTILNASTGITGTFSTVNGTSIDSTKHFSVTYNPTTVVLTVVSGPVPPA